MSRTVLALCVLVSLNARAWGHPAGQLGDEVPIQVPGGVAALAQALGAGEAVPRVRLMPVAIRVLWEAPEAVDAQTAGRRAAALAYLAQIETIAPGAAPADALPGLLPSQAWSRVLHEVGATGKVPFTAILGNRRAALLYHGLSSLDARTREYLASRSELLEKIAEDDRVALFATFGRSLRVRGGLIEPPGGAEALPLWEDVVGEKVSDPPAFVLRVLSRDGGRLALLYDGLAHLPEPARRFALGLALPPDKRVDRFRAFYDAAAAALQSWQPERRPFERMPFDAVHLLLSTPFEPDGHLPGPAWPSLWRAVFDPLFDPEKGLKAKDLGDDDRCDAATLLELVSVRDPVEREQRARTWLFAQRIFRQPRPQTARELVLTLKAVARYPTLFVTLDRMGISDLATYASAVRAADQLGAADIRLWLFQAALSIVERARSARSLDRAAADALVRQLCALTPEGGARYRGAIVRWIEADLLPAAGDAVLSPDLAATDRPIETRLLAVMAGSVRSPANMALLALAPLEWEGLTYRIDPGASTLRHLVEVRGRQGGHSLDAVIALSRLADAIAGAASPATAATAARQLPAAASALRPENGEGVRRFALAGDLPDLEELSRRAIDRARKLKAGDRGAAANLARPLQEAVDRYLAPVLGSIAYAPHVGEPDGPALLAGDPSRVHDFRLFTPGTELGRRTAWQPPVEVRDSRIAWGVSGSLLALEEAMAAFSLRRPFTESFPPPPTLSDAERQTFTESAVLPVAQDFDAAASRALVQALDRGRKRVEALGASNDEVERFAVEIELDEWRAQALAWTIANEPDRRLGLLSLAELARAGGLDPGAQGGLDTWGTSEYARDGALVAAYPARLPWTTLAGRRGVRAVASLVPDLAIGLAESCARLNLPAALTPALSRVASQRFIESVQTAHPDDWLTMTAEAQAVAREGLEDYLAVLTIAGPLVPESK